MSVLNRGKIDISPMLRMLNQLHELGPDIEAYLQERVVAIDCRKGRMLLKNGALCHHLYFIRKGAIRGFIRDGDKDVTTWISVEDEIVTSISGLNRQAPSPENIQAIENCELLAITFDDLHELYERFPVSNIVGRKLLQYYYQDAEARAFICRISGTESKYNHFLLHYPRLVNRVPVKYVASFLGVTLETLSRIRRKISL